MKLKYLIPFCLFLAVIVGLTDTPVPLNVWRTNSVVASPTNFWRSNVIAGPFIGLTPTSSNITIGVAEIVGNYLTTNQTFLQVGALTNNGADGFGWFNLTNLAQAGAFILRSNGFGTNTTLVGANGTNGLTIIDTAIPLVPFDDPAIAAFRNNGTNIVTMYAGGGMLIGRTAFDFWGAPEGESLVSVFDTAIGEPFYNEIDIYSRNSTNGDIANVKLDVEASGQGRIVLSQKTSGLTYNITFQVDPPDTIGIFAESSSYGPVFTFGPATVDETGNSSSYYFDTLVSRTNAWLVRVLNQGTTKFGVRGPGNIYSAALTPSTVLQANSSTNIASIPNALGALTNNGSGTLGWYDLTLLAPATGGTYIATNAGTGWDTTIRSSSTNTVPLRIETEAGLNLTNFLQIATNGGQPFFVVSSNKYLGVGTNTPIVPLHVNGAARFESGSSLAITLTNATIQMGGTSSSFTAVRRNGSTVEAILADGSDYADTRVRKLLVLAVAASSGDLLDVQNSALTGSGAGSILASNATFKGNLTVNKGLTFSRFATNGNVTMLTNFYVWAWTEIAVAGTLTLPSASTSQGIHFIIKDEGGNAAATNITIAVQSGDAIDAATTATLNANYAAKRLYSAGSTNWFTY